MMENKDNHTRKIHHHTKVLIVEDEPELADLLRRYLEKRGYAVAVSDSIFKAREGLYEMEPEIVFLDINLPDGLGLDLIPFLRRNHSCRIIAMSADDSYMNNALGGQLHADVFLVKPFKLETVGKMLEIVDSPSV